MNVAALLQDSPSDDRRRPSPTDRRQNHRSDSRSHAQSNSGPPSATTSTPGTTSTTTPTTLPLHPTPILNPSSSRPLADPIYHPPSPPHPAASSGPFSHHRARPVPHSPAMASLTPTPSRPSSSLPTHMREVMQPQSSWGSSQVYDPALMMDSQPDRERERERERRDWDRDRDRERERKVGLGPNEDHLPLVGPSPTQSTRQSAISNTEMFTVPSGPPIQTARVGNKISLGSSSGPEERDRDLKDPDRERDRIHPSIREREWVRDLGLREREPIREYDVRDREREKDSERERDRDREREQRERDREDMDIIRAVASSRGHKPSLLQGRASPRTHTPTEILVLHPTNHSHTHRHTHLAHEHSQGPILALSPHSHGLGYVHGPPPHASHPSLPPPSSSLAPIPHTHAHSQAERSPHPPTQSQHQQPRPQQHFQSQFHTQFVLGPSSRPTSRIPSPSPATPRIPGTGTSANIGTIAIGNSTGSDVGLTRATSPNSYEHAHIPTVVAPGGSGSGNVPVQQKSHGYPNPSSGYAVPPPEQTSGYLHPAPPYDHHNHHGKSPLQHASVIDVNGDSGGGRVGIGYGQSDGVGVIHGGTDAKPFTLTHGHAHVPDFAPPADAEPAIVVHLGTFVYPRTPFPYFFPTDHMLAGSVTVRDEEKNAGKSTGTEERMDVDAKEGPPGGKGKDADKGSDAEEVKRDTRTTIIIPSGFLPLDKPARPRIWGGGVAGYASRRVYTDDSDIFLCALHAGWVTWAGARRARREGRDLRVEVRIVDMVGVRFVGGWGERYVGHMGRRREYGYGAEMDEDEDDDGRGLVSAGWGSGHDGSGIEVLEARFVEKGTARCTPGLGLRNRAQRLLEYGERRAAMLDLRPWFTQRLAGRKRRRGWMFPPSRRTPNAIELYTILEEDESGDREEIKSDTRTVVTGTADGNVRLGFKYDPGVLRSVLFPRQPAHAGGEVRTKTREPSRKRRRVRGGAVDSERDDGNTARGSMVGQNIRIVILDTSGQSYLLSLSASGSGVRYDVSQILAGDPVSVSSGRNVEEEEGELGMDTRPDDTPETSVTAGTTPQLNPPETDGKDADGETTKAVEEAGHALEKTDQESTDKTPISATLDSTAVSSKESGDSTKAVTDAIEPNDDSSGRDATRTDGEPDNITQVSSVETGEGGGPVKTIAASGTVDPGADSSVASSKLRIVCRDVGEDGMIFRRDGVELVGIGDVSGTKGGLLEVTMWRFSD